MCVHHKRYDYSIELPQTQILLMPFIPPIDFTVNWLLFIYYYYYYYYVSEPCVSYAYIYIVVTMFGTATRDVFTVTQRNKYALTTAISYPIPPQYTLIYKSITVCAYRSNLLIVHFQYINCNLYTLKCRVIYECVDRAAIECIACIRTSVMIARVVKVS